MGDELKPAAFIVKEALDELGKHPGASATVWSGKATHRFAQSAEPLYPASVLTALMDENERLRERLDAGPHGEDAIDVAESAMGHLRHSLAVAEARATAAETEAATLRALLAEAVGALEPFEKAANIKLCGNWLDHERFAQTDVGFHLNFGHLRAARAVSAKIKEITGE